MDVLNIVRDIAIPCLDAYSIEIPLRSRTALPMVQGGA